MRVERLLEHPMEAEEARYHETGDDDLSLDRGQSSDILEETKEEEEQEQPLRQLHGGGGLLRRDEISRSCLEGIEDREWFGSPFVSNETIFEIWKEELLSGQVADSKGEGKEK
jgi:hypothetical protein